MKSPARLPAHLESSTLRLATLTREAEEVERLRSLFSAPLTAHPLYIWNVLTRQDTLPLLSALNPSPGHFLSQCLQPNDNF